MRALHPEPKADLIHPSRDKVPPDQKLALVLEPEREFGFTLTKAT